MARAEYTIIGRYMDGPKVTGYHVQDINSEKSIRFSKESICLLVGKGQVLNCSGRIYNDKVLLEGVGISLNDLPVMDEKTGQLKNVDSLGRIARGVTNEQAMAQFIVIGRIMQRSKIVGFRVKNAGGISADLSRENIERLAQELKIGNMRFQLYNPDKGNERKEQRLLRMLDGTKLTDLPIVKELPVENLPNKELKKKPSIEISVDEMLEALDRVSKMYTYDTEHKFNLGKLMREGIITVQLAKDTQDNESVFCRFILNKIGTDKNYSSMIVEVSDNKENVIHSEKILSKFDWQLKYNILQNIQAMCIVTSEKILKNGFKTVMITAKNSVGKVDIEDTVITVSQEIAESLGNA